MVQELRPRSIGEILDVAVTLYRRRIGPLLRVGLIVEVPIQLFSMLILLSALPDEFTVGFGQAQPVYENQDDAALGFAASSAVLVLSFVSTYLVTALASRFIADTYTSATNVPPATTAKMGARLPVAIGAALAASAGIVAGIFACVIPGIWLIGVWSVAMPVLMLEGTDAIRSLGRSLELVRSRFWSAFGVITIGMMLTTTISWSITLVFELLITTEQSLESQVISQSIAGTLSAILTTPFIACAVVALYFDLRIRKEAFDVQMMMTQLDTGRA